MVISVRINQYLHPLSKGAVRITARSIKQSN